MYNSEEAEKIIKRLDMFVYEPADLNAIRDDLLTLFIPVDAADAKDWYGAGGNFLESIDASAKFANRIASEKVQKRFSNNIGFSAVWSAITALEYTNITDLGKVGALTIATVMRANILEENEDAAMEFAKVMAEAISATKN